MGRVARSLVVGAGVLAAWLGCSSPATTETCQSGQMLCDNSCVPAGVTCCHYGNGAICPAGDACGTSAQVPCIKGTTSSSSGGSSTSSSSSSGGSCSDSQHRMTGCPDGTQRCCSVNMVCCHDSANGGAIGCEFQGFCQ